MTVAVKQRDSSLELYRIIVMLAIVAHRYAVSSGLWKCVLAIFTVCTIVDLLRQHLIERPLFGILFSDRNKCLRRI